jgi:heterotetrameric sarcosine oxidase delta subunit
MMLIPCFFCGPRDETEFTYGGEADISRPAIQADDARWADYLYFRNNTRGIHAERWRHARGCGQWFNAVRDTTTHRFITVYLPTAPSPMPSAGALIR